MRGLESAALCVQLVGEILVCIQENLPTFFCWLSSYILYMFRMGLSCCMSNGIDRSTNVLSCLKWCL